MILKREKGPKNIDILNLSQVVLLHLFTQCADDHKLHF